MNKTLLVKKSNGYLHCFLEYNKDFNDWGIHHYHFYDNFTDIVNEDGDDFESVVFPIFGCEEYFVQENIECPIKDISIKNVYGNPIAIYVAMYTDGDYNYDYINGDGSGICAIAIYKCEKTESVTIV